MADWTGTISAAQTFADGDRITGDVTVSTGGVVTVTAGATITFTGNYSITVQLTGKIVATGTAASRIIFKSSSTNPTDGDWSLINMSGPTSTGNSFQYCDFQHGGHSQNVLRIQMGTGGTINTISYCRFMNCLTGAGVGAGGNTADITFANCYFSDLETTAFYLNDASSKSHTIQDCEINGAGDKGITIASSTQTITIKRCLIKNCDVGISHDAAATVTIDKNFIIPPIAIENAANPICVSTTAAATTPLLTVSNNVLGGYKRLAAHIIYSQGAVGTGITSSGNDITGGQNTNGAGIRITDVDNGSTSNNDYIAGCAGAALDNADTTNATSSTETPAQYQNLTDARTNARSTVNYAATIDTVVATAQAQGAAFTWNSNRPMNSEIYLDRASGIDTDDPTTYEACWVADDDWSQVKYGASANRGTYKDKSTGMIGTAHSATVAGLIGGTTYYYVVRGVDPAGNTAESTEGNFKTTGSAGSTTVTIVPGQMVGVTPAKQLTKAPPVRFPLPKKKKYGKIERE